MKLSSVVWEAVLGLRQGRGCPGISLVRVLGVQGRSQLGLGADVVSCVFCFFFFFKGSPEMFGDSAGGRFPALKPCLGQASQQAAELVPAAGGA